MFIFMSSYKLSDSIRWVKGVGKKRAERLEKLGINTVRDFLYFPPRKYLNRSEIKNICDVSPGEHVTILGKIVSINSRRSRNNKLITDVTIYDKTGMINGRWFNQRWVEKSFTKGKRVYFSGKVEFYRGLQIINPDYEFISEKDSRLIHTGGIIPIYPLTEGINQRFMRRTANRILENTRDKVKDPLPNIVIERHKLLNLTEALENIHFPENEDRLNRAKYRLSFDELLYLQLYLFLKRKWVRNLKGFTFEVDSKLKKKYLNSIPFKLTESQKKVLSEIENDMKSGYPMNRLLQGDVGSGKTVVAVAAMLIAVDNGYNCVFMVPTEILAYQQHNVVKNMLEDLEVPSWLLVGGMKERDRNRILNRIKSKRGIIIGTHALLQEDVEIPNLGLIVIDEQHRFGVNQRYEIQKKSNRPDTLVMSATPIPRTLALSVYGELEVSTIEELPPGRTPSKTRWVKEKSKREDVYKWVRDRVLQENIKTYIVFPVIEESENSELKSIENESKKLKKSYFSDMKVEILHGRMSGTEKDSKMKRFKHSDVNILISTTVIEVGIDIPEANIMVVENADRFGLAQLHQLRGRIGRGDKKSYFIMISDKEKITEKGRKRLESLEKYDSGFKLSEVDLFLRGPGEFFGTKQHGFPDFKYFDPLKDRKIIGRVRNAVKEIIERGLEKRFKRKINEMRDKSDYFTVG